MRRLLKNWLKQTATRDLSAQNSCRMMLSSFGSVIKAIYISSTEKFTERPTVSICCSLQQRIKRRSRTPCSHKNDVQSIGAIRSVKITLGLLQFAICRSSSQGPRNLLLWLTFVITIATWHMLGLWRVRISARQCPGIHVTLVLTN